jgi:hypothetical protein
MWPTAMRTGGRPWFRYRLSCATCLWTSRHRRPLACSCITSEGTRGSPHGRDTCSFTRSRPPPQQISIFAAVATSPNDTEGERAGYCSRSPARQRPRLGDPRGPKGHATAASLLQRRRRHHRRAGSAGPTATTSVFTVGQPHAPTWINVPHGPSAPPSPSLAHVVVRSRGSPSSETQGGGRVGGEAGARASPSGERRGTPAS